MTINALLAVALLAQAPAGGATVTVTLCESGGTGIPTEVLRPASGANGASIVYVHGGNWFDDQGLEQQFGLHDPVSPASRAELGRLVQHGYVVFVPHYRGSPRYKFPTHVIDLKCAMRALRARAGEFGIDADRIGVMGASAGGHLAALLGLAGPAAGWDIGAYPDVSSRPRAVADFSGPSDLSGPIPLPAVPLALTVFGSAETNAPVLTSASPVTYVSKDAPPFLIVHGDADRIVPPAASRELYDRLRSAGAEASLVIVRDAGHDLRPTTGHASTEPSADELTARLIAFFDRTLAPSDARETIEKANAAWLPAVLKKDPAPIVEPYAEDSVFITATGEAASGRGAILKLMRERFAKPVTITGGDLKQDGIALAGPLIYEWGHATLTLSDGTTSAGRYLTVWARGADGRWRISRNLSLP
jgi:uncharacterized protein (TIGR02246 family)